MAINTINRMNAHDNRLSLSVSLFLFLTVISWNYQSIVASEEKLASPPVTVGAYYYPWHGDDFHNGQGYLRSQLKKEQSPTLGEYDDTKEKTIQTHLDFSNVGNIQVWVTSWWGPNHDTDVTSEETILKRLKKSNSPVRIALFYESSNRLRDDDRKWALNKDKVKGDIEHMRKNYFDHGNYYKINGKPVVFIYLTRVLQIHNSKDGNLLEDTVALMRATAKEEIYVVGDHAFDRYPDDRNSEKAALHNSSLAVLDAITNYNVKGSIVKKSTNMYAGVDRVSDYYDEHQVRWKQMAAEHNCAFIPSVQPGFNDRGVRPEKGRIPLSRRSAPDAPEGSFFQASLEKAVKLVDPLADNLLVVTTFNVRKQASMALCGMSKNHWCVF